jgi:preprotein translocase subunit SecA
MKQGPPTPGLEYGLYPEHQPKPYTFSGNVFSRVKSLGETLHPFPLWRYRGFINHVQHLATPYVSLDDRTLKGELKRHRAQLRKQGLASLPLVKAVALLQEVIYRELGIRLFDCQLLAARIMLDKRLAEMHTGEGKTLAIAMAAMTAAMAGIPVHIITANDYLVERDADQLQRICSRIGLSVGAVMTGMAPDQRRDAYACDITYCTAKELVFDYLRDRILPRQGQGDLHCRAMSLTDAGSSQNRVLRGLCMVIIDEADSILLDEAITPLILSREEKNAIAENHYLKAMEVAHQLENPVHFILDDYTREAELTRVGSAEIEKKTQGWGGLWMTARFREGLIGQALAALYLYHRDRDYLLKDDAVHIIDPTTGRRAEGRQWSRGLHQLLEMKEDCLPSNEFQAIAQITYQRFFPRYLQLGGTSATLRESRGELQFVYELPVVKVPRRKSSHLTYLPQRLYFKRRYRWRAVVKRVIELRAQGRPVLIGTDSVADSEALARSLRSAQVPHEVLNARQDDKEAHIVARAGKSKQVTVTTNMAGRGTDIPLEESVVECGGLHVICCQHNASRRIDRQLRGRCGRQGEPGSVETLLCLEDTLIARHLSAKMIQLLSKVFDISKPLPRWLGVLLSAIPQRLEESRQRDLRDRLRRSDRQVQQWLAISGRGE